ncbi:hypothetical protein ACFL5O_07655 [Myxococcota bacterium]
MVMTREELLKQLEVKLAETLREHGISTSVLSLDGFSLRDPSAPERLQLGIRLGTSALPDPLGTAALTADLFAAEGDRSAISLPPKVLDLLHAAIKDFVEEHEHEFAILCAAQTDPHMLN